MIGALLIIGMSVFLGWMMRVMVEELKAQPANKSLEVLREAVHRFENLEGEYANELNSLREKLKEFEKGKKV